MLVPQYPASQHVPNCTRHLSSLIRCCPSPSRIPRILETCHHVDLSATHDSTIFFIHPQSCVYLRHDSGISPHLSKPAPSQLLQIQTGTSLFCCWCQSEAIHPYSSSRSQRDLASFRTDSFCPVLKGGTELPWLHRFLGFLSSPPEP